MEYAKEGYAKAKALAQEYRIAPRLLGKYITLEKLASTVKPSKGEEGPQAVRERRRLLNFQTDLERQLEVTYNYQISENIQLQIGLYRGVTSLKIPKGKIEHGCWVANLDLENMSAPKKGEGLKSYTLRIRTELRSSLSNIATLCANGRVAGFRQIKALFGLSYFANRTLAEDFGFWTTEIVNREQKLRLTNWAYGVILQNRFGNNYHKWEEYLASIKIFREPHYAFMSRAVLFDRYLPKANKRPS